MATLTASTPYERPRLSTFSQAMLSFYWFGTSVHWTAILITTLPKQAELIGGDAIKGTVLGITLGLGAFVSMIVAPFFGYLSDRVNTRMGRRRPWIILGSLMNVVGLYGLATFARENDLSSLPLYIFAFAWVEFWNNVATAPYSALIPDVVPAEQRGSASGWYGLMNIFGTFVGAALPLIVTQNGVTDISAIYAITGGCLLLGMLGTVIFVREPKVTKLPPFRWGEFWRGLLEPFKDHDFRWLFWTRFLMVLGVFVVQEFLQYYMGDVIQQFSLFGNTIATNPETAASLFIVALLVGAIPASLAAGYLSDRFGRKRAVYISSALQAIVPFVLVFFTSFDAAFLIGIVFGIGYGAYQSVDWAMAADVMPNPDDYAKDMAVWHVASTLPQTLGTPVAGVVRDQLTIVGTQMGNPNLGYNVIFLMASGFFAMGTVLVRNIRKVK